MIKHVRTFPYLLSTARCHYVVCAYVDQMPAGRWEAWFAFFPVEGGPVMAGDRETTQRSVAEVHHWAGAISAVYLQGALHRASRGMEAPRWRHSAPGRDARSYMSEEKRRYRTAAPRMRALGRRLLEQANAPRPRRGASDAVTIDGPVTVREVIIERHAPASEVERPGGLSHATAEVPPPSEIKARLDDYVVGQERAKKVLAVAVVNHYKRLQLKNEPAGLLPKKSNVLMLGPSGSGKTLLVETLAGVLQVPFTLADATRFTEAGYVGADVEDIVADLLAAAGGQVAQAERGIVYIDEIDKLASRETSGRDVSGQGVQQALLKLLEGRAVPISPERRRSKDEPPVKVDTTDVLFICGGAFVGLDGIVGGRTKGHRIGFETQNGAGPAAAGDVLWEVTPRDLVSFGMIPEFVGRLPVVVALDALDETALMEILTRPKDALVKQYQELFRMDGVSLRFSPGALRALARRARSLGTGARGLRTALESVMLELMYGMPRSRRPRIVEVTEDVVELRAAPSIRYER